LADAGPSGTPGAARAVRHRQRGTGSPDRRQRRRRRSV